MKDSSQTSSWFYTWMLRDLPRNKWIKPSQIGNLKTGPFENFWRKYPFANQRDPQSSGAETFDAIQLDLDSDCNTHRRGNLKWVSSYRNNIPTIIRSENQRVCLNLPFLSPPRHHQFSRRRPVVRSLMLNPSPIRDVCAPQHSPMHTFLTSTRFSPPDTGWLDFVMQAWFVPQSPHLNPFQPQMIDNLSRSMRNSAENLYRGVSSRICCKWASRTAFTSDSK